MNDDEINFRIANRIANNEIPIDHIWFDERKINITNLTFTITKVNGEHFDFNFDFNRLVQLGIITPKVKT